MIKSSLQTRPLNEQIMSALLTIKLEIHNEMDYSTYYSGIDIWLLFRYCT